MCDLSELHARAVAAGGRPPALYDTDKVKLAHAALVDAIVTAVPSAVETAVEAGVTAAVLYEFGHEATFDGVDVLYLLRGPRRPAVMHRGVPSVLSVLRDALAPFTVRHHWDQAMHRNYVVIRWPKPQ